MFRGCSGLFRAVPGVFRGCSGDVPGVFRGVPGCSGFYRHPEEYVYPIKERNAHVKNAIFIK